MNLTLFLLSLKINFILKATIKCFQSITFITIKISIFILILVHSSEHRKKAISFNDLIKLLHRQLPINIISQYLDITKLDNAEMTKILRNTLTDKGKKTS